MKNKKSLFILGCLSLVIVTLSPSCVQLKDISYINDINNLSSTYTNPRESKKIKANDILYIRVVSTDSETARLLNFYEAGGQAGTTPQNVMGYTVDNNGDISFPFVGKINLLGLSTDEAQEKIHDALSKVISNYTIIVRFLENNVSVLGEVNSPGVYTFTPDVLTIYEALAYAGGIAKTGDFRKVVLIRQNGDEISHYRLDLTDSQITNKPQYYIQPNDVLVVEPSKIATRLINLPDFSTILGLFSSLISTFILIYTFTVTHN